MDKSKIRKLLNQKQDDLLYQLGRSLTQNELFASPPSFNEFVRIAERWLNQKDSELKKLICMNMEIKEHINDFDEIALCAAIADLIATIAFGVPPFTVAALIVKKSVVNYCQDHWE